MIWQRPCFKMPWLFYHNRWYTRNYINCVKVNNCYCFQMRFNFQNGALRNFEKFTGKHHFYRTPLGDCNFFLTAPLFLQFVFNCSRISSKIFLWNSSFLRKKSVLTTNVLKRHPTEKKLPWTYSSNLAAFPSFT